MSQSLGPEAILEGLTEPQRTAVTHGDGPLLVLAGPGSGKTRVITRRAAYLAATATDAQHVLAITFTNKAAEEMACRIRALGVGPDLTVCTFHSFGARLLRRFAARAGISPTFTIFDQTDRLAAIREAICRSEVPPDSFHPGRIEARISHLKNAMISPTEAEQVANEFEKRLIARVYAVYEKILCEQNALDFDDLLLRTARLLGDDPELRERLENHYRYLLVDEYQDTNHAQYLIARALALTHHNLCATGDPDQSIYGWRGANLGNIMDFERDFPETKVVRLEQNYRSTKHILAAADHLISHNRDRRKKRLWTCNVEGAPVRIVEFDNAEAEARYIAQQIRDLADRKIARFSDVAVFYRVNAITRRIEDALRLEGIPYRIVRGVEFYSRKEIKDVTAYLRVLINPQDEISLLRIINTPARGIGGATIERLAAHARAAGIPLMQCVLEPGLVDGLNKAAVARIKAFGRLLRSLAPLVHASAREGIEQVLASTGYRTAVAGDPDAVGNVDELVSAAARYDCEHPAGSLIEWLEQISLTSDQDVYDPADGAVTLMTLHAAKGLEFPVVFIAACEEGLLPHERHRESRKELEEAVSYTHLTLPTIYSV